MKRGKYPGDFTRWPVTAGLPIAPYAPDAPLPPTSFDGEARERQAWATHDYLLALARERKWTTGPLRDRSLSDEDWARKHGLL